MKGLILVTGSEGLVGSRFVEISERKNFLHLPKQIEFDITDKSEVKAIISSFNFSAIVNFAAYTDVGKAEEERGNENGLCWQVNVEGVRNLAEAVAPHKAKIHLIHISTDMVFPGSKMDPGPYLENHPLNHDLSQLTWYGYTKAEGEKAVRDVLGEYATILRLIYPVRASFEGKLDYLRKPLSLYDEGKLYPLFPDQQVSITYIDEACKVLDKIIIDNHRGTFHASSRDTANPHQLVTYMLEKTRDLKDSIAATTLDDFLQKSGAFAYRYPKYGGLNTDITAHKLGIKFSSWREIVDKLVAQGLGEKQL